MPACGESVDPNIRAGDIEQLDKQLNTASVPLHIVTYAGASHSFVDRQCAEYVATSADAWTRMLNFINKRTL